MLGVEAEVLTLQKTIFPVGLQAETEARSEPLTNGYVNTVRTSVMPVFLEETSLVRILNCHVNTNLYEPVAPERICSNSVL